MKQITFKEKRITEYTGAMAQLYSTAKKYPVLSKEEEATATVDQLINHNLLFVISVAKRYQHSNVDILDLIQEGRIGLIKAARSYDSTFGFRFISYAVTKIQAEIIRFIESKCDTLRIPDALHRVSWKLENNQKEFETLAETAERLGITKVNLHNHINRKKLVSFSAEDSEGETYVDVPGDLHADSITMQNDLSNIINMAIQKLPDREQSIINLRFFNNFCLLDVAEKVGLSSERVRQIEMIALKKLKVLIAESI
jgi:RNA polymerase primary sigma factor